MLTCNYMQNVIKIFHVVQEVWSFSLTYGRTNILTKRFLLGIFYVRKSNQQAPISFYEINLNLSLSAPLIWWLGLGATWESEFSEIQSSQQVSYLASGRTDGLT